jgi:hypothetical protein
LHKPKRKLLTLVLALLSGPALHATIITINETGTFTTSFNPGIAVGDTYAFQVTYDDATLAGMPGITHALASSFSFTTSGSFAPQYPQGGAPPFIVNVEYAGGSYHDTNWRSTSASYPLFEFSPDGSGSETFYWFTASTAFITDKATIGTTPGPSTPEPGTAGLMATALLALATLARKRQVSQSKARR